MFALSGNFKDYLHGLVKLPQDGFGDTQHPDLAKCTFKPTVNKNSIKLD